MTIAESIQQRLFNRGILDKEDPTEGIGSLILPFSFYHVYDDISNEEISRVCDELYTNVAAKLREGSLGNDIKYQIVNFQDAKQRSGEKPRKYIVITRETNRKTRITIHARFLPYGKKLYVGVDSYVLGSLDIWQVVWRLLVTLLPLACIVPSIGMNMLSIPFAGIMGNSYTNDFASAISGSLSSILGSVCCCLLPWMIVTIPIFWIKVYRNYQQENDISLAVRQSYNRIISGQSFNTDDVLMTLKSVLPLILYSIRDVFEENDIPVRTLDAFVETIKTVNNIQNVYGSYNAVAGQGGVATSNTNLDAA